MKAGLRGIQVQPVTRGRGGKNETAARSGSSAHFGRLVRGVSTYQPVAWIRSGGAQGAIGSPRVLPAEAEAARVILYEQLLPLEI
jgi:hypothetical protein